MCYGYINVCTGKKKETYRAPVFRSNTSDKLDSLLSEVKFSKNFFVGQGSHQSVRPSVTSKMVTVLDTTLSTIRPVHDVGTNVEHGGLQLVLFKIVIEGVMRTVGSIIKGLNETIRRAQKCKDKNSYQAPDIGFRTSVDVSVDTRSLGSLTGSAGPPTSGISSSVVAGHVKTTGSSELSDGEVGSL